MMVKIHGFKHDVMFAAGGLASCQVKERVLQQPLGAERS